MARASVTRYFGSRLRVPALFAVRKKPLLYDASSSFISQRNQPSIRKVKKVASDKRQDHLVVALNLAIGAEAVWCSSHLRDFH